MSIGYAGPGWEWPSKADVFYQTAGVAKQFEARRTHGKSVNSAKVELQMILRSEIIVMPPFGKIIKDAPYERTIPYLQSLLAENMQRML